MKMNTAQTYKKGVFLNPFFIKVLSVT